MDGRATRRRFLSALGAGRGRGRPGSGGGAGGHWRLGPGVRGVCPVLRQPIRPGIATPSQQCVHFLALDVVSASAGDLRILLRTLSGAAAAIAHGRPVGALATGFEPPVDTGEAIGRPTARTTVTLGLGPAIFAPGRFGLAAKRPAPLVYLPSFPGDALVPGWTGGDIGVQVCSDDPQVAFHAVHDLIRLAAPDRRAALVAGRIWQYGQQPPSGHAAQPHGLQGRDQQHQGRGRRIAGRVRVGRRAGITGLDARRLLHGAAAHRDAVRTLGRDQPQSPRSRPSGATRCPARPWAASTSTTGST